MGNILDCTTDAPIPSAQQPEDVPVEASRGPPAFIVAGPSGVGKGTLIAKFMKNYPQTFGFSVSHCSRAPRPGEIDGVNYHFTDVVTMQEMIASGKFIEHAEVFGKYYGTSFEAVEAVQKLGKICILDIDVQGCRSCRAAGLKGKYIFLLAPSLEELERRLRGRGTEDEETLQRRLASAASEIEAVQETGLFDQAIVNDDIDDCYNQVEGMMRKVIESIVLPTEISS